MEKFFRKLGLDIIIPFILILLIFLFFVGYNQACKKILVIHSYNPSYTWVDGINKGLETVFKDTEIKVEYFYMDTRKNYQEHLKEQAGIEARKMINQSKPDVVIACDDEAQKYVTTYYINNPDILFVFTGVNAEIEDYGFDKAHNVTGILERLPLEGLNDAIIEMASSLKIQGLIRIGHISGSSHSTKLDDEYMHGYKNWNRIVLKPSQLVINFSDWKKAILDANTDLDFIIISNYKNVVYSATNKNLVPASEILKWTVENSKIPIVGVNSFVVEDGAPLAISISNIEQGEAAAKMALKIIQDKIPVNQLPIQKPQQFIVSMRAHLMKKFSMVLPEVYTAFARVNHSYFE